MTAIKGDYRTHKHIPSRSCYQLIIEVSEEEFPKVCDTLGYPKTGENTYVGIALLNKSVISKKETPEQTEGEKLRTRAVMLCKDSQFYKWARTLDITYGIIDDEANAKEYIKRYCEIESRADLAWDTQAQEKFKAILSYFDAWKISCQYADNLSR